ETWVLIDNFLEPRLRAFETTLSSGKLHVLVEHANLEVVHREVFLNLREASLDGRTERALRILLQKNFQPLLRFARMRDVAVGETHLSHLCFSDFQTRIVCKWIGWEKRKPVLISLRR